MSLVLILTGVMSIWISNNIVPSKITTAEDLKQRKKQSSKIDGTLNDETEHLRDEDVDDLH